MSKTLVGNVARLASVPSDSSIGVWPTKAKGMNMARVSTNIVATTVPAASGIAIPSIGRTNAPLASRFVVRLFRSMPFWPAAMNIAWTLLSRSTRVAMPNAVLDSTMFAASGTFKSSDQYASPASALSAATAHATCAIEVICLPDLSLDPGDGIDDEYASLLRL